MVQRRNELSPERVLVLAPVGRDADMLCERIVDDGLACEACPDIPSLAAGISSGAGAVIVAQEALSYGGAEALLAALEAQEPWSDIPVLLLAEARSTRPGRAVGAAASSALFERGNVTVLQRPLGVPLLASSIRSAIRARRRQYQLRDLHRELERAVQLSDLFVSILGHDLRSPLGAIRLAAEAIVRLSPETRALRPAGRILTAADRMTRMIEQLLDFARARQGQGIPIHVGPTHLADVCRQAVLELEDASPDAVFHVRSVGDLAGVWDVDRLAQVMTNLVGNAVQHGTPGEPIDIELDGSDPAAVRARIHNAGAIPAAALPTLFEAFKETSARATGGRRSGLGLGLFIAREIVRAHGGDIYARSSGGRTTFEFTLARDARPLVH